MKLVYRDNIRVIDEKQRAIDDPVLLHRIAQRYESSAVFFKGLRIGQYPGKLSTTDGWGNTYYAGFTLGSALNHLGLIRGEARLIPDNSEAGLRLEVSYLTCTKISPHWLPDLLLATSQRLERHFSYRRSVQFLDGHAFCLQLEPDVRAALATVRQVACAIPDDAASRFALSPLIQATYDCHPNIIRSAIRNGDDLSMVNQFDESLLMNVLDSQCPDYESLAWELIRSGCDLFHKSRITGENALFPAAQASPAILKHLLTTGLNPNTKSTFSAISGQTPLFVAIESGNRDSINTLLQHGADPTVVCDAGFTILHYLQPQNIDLLDDFIRAGVDINRRNCNGDSACDLASLEANLAGLNDYACKLQWKKLANAMKRRSFCYHQR